MRGSSRNVPYTVRQLLPSTTLPARSAVGVRVVRMTLDELLAWVVIAACLAGIEALAARLE